MSDKISMNKFDEITKATADGLLAFVRDKVKTRKWTQAYLDIRFPTHGGGRMEKCLIQYANGKVADVDHPSELSFGMSEVLDARGDLFAKKWYGLIIRVYPNSKWEKEFNYDPDCIRAPGYVC